MEKNLILGIGEALWDCLPEGRKIGGAPANFAYHAGQFGWRNIVVSAVGNDALGDEYLEQLADVKLEPMIARVPFPTGTVQVTISGEGIPSYEICENVAWDNIPWTDALEALAKETRAVCFGSLAQRRPVSRATIHRFLESMSPDSERVFDINLRQSYYNREIIGQNLERATILKLNDEEVEVVKDQLHLDGSPESVCRQLIGKYGSLRIVILTCGTVGSHVFTADTASYVETPRVKVADTVGAGDSFTATFVSDILKGNPIETAHKHAVAVSAFVCTQNGAMPVLPEELRGI